jgi:hypothetical protein
MHLPSDHPRIGLLSGHGSFQVVCEFEYVLGLVRGYQKVINPTTEEGNSPQKFVQTKVHMISWEITLAINHFSYNH